MVSPGPPAEAVVRPVHPIYYPAVNVAARTALRPFARWIPPRYRFLVTGTIAVDLPGGRRVRLACNPTSHLARLLFWEGMEGYEPDLVRAFIPLARRCETFLDVGAALGYYALVAAACNPSARIVAFEPMPGAFRYLARNVALNGAANVRPERLALSDRAGTARFFVTTNPKFAWVEDHLAGTSGLDRQQAARLGALREVEVRTETLDGYVAAHLAGARVDLVKLDTEATEHLVLAGAEGVLAEHRPVVLCEVLPGQIEAALEAVFARHGYLYARAVPGGLALTARLTHDGATTNDHVMIPRERLDWVRRTVPFR